MVKAFRKRGGLRVKCWDLTLLFSLTLLGLMSFLNVSDAADYPAKPIQIVVPFPPGGGGDITARLVGEKVSSLLGQVVVVVNKTGGTGTIGTYALLAAPPDGYTILQTPPPPHMAPLVRKGITYSSRDFTPINLSVSAPNIVVVKKDARWQTLEELVADAKKNPGKITIAISGYGSSSHFAAELFKIQTGTDLTCIPIEGVAQANTAVLGGHVNVGTPEVGGSTFTYLQAGSFRGLAVMGKNRINILPDIPTGVEKGYPNMVNAVWQGFIVRSETPKIIVEKLDKVFKQALRDKDLIEKFEKTAWIVENLGSEEMARFLVNEQQKWLEVAKAANIVPK